MARWEESVKRREWNERLARFTRWGGTVAEFCDTERVSAPSFYQWKRKLAGSGAGVGAGVGKGQCSAADRRSVRETSRTFVPVQLVSTTSAESAGTTVEIELPNGTLVRLPASDRQLLAVAIAAAGQVAALAGVPLAPSADASQEEAAC
jgi:hypothetical protein